MTIRFATGAAVTAVVAALAVAPVSAQEQKQKDEPAKTEQSAQPQSGASAQANGEAVDITAWDPTVLYAAGWSVEEFLDAEVYDQDGEQIGEVEDLIVGPEGVVKRMVIEAGGFLDIGDTHLAYPWENAQIETLDRVVVSFDEDNVEDYSLFRDVEGEPAQGRNWRITELLGDYAYLEGAVPYGWIDDVVIKEGKVAAVVVHPDVTYGVAGPYAWPYYADGFDPGLNYYELPYGPDEVAVLDPFDPDELSETVD